MKQTKIPRPEHRLRQILELTKDQWDKPTERDAVRVNFSKICACRTRALRNKGRCDAIERLTFLDVVEERGM